MIIIKMLWTKENVREFVTFYTIRKSKTQKILLISYLICAAVIFVFGLTAYALINEIAVLIVSLGAFAVMAGYMAFFYLMMRSMEKKLLIANEENNNLEICFNEDIIFFRKTDSPYGTIEWGNITEIYISKNAAYLMSKESALILIEFNRIIAGNKEDLIKLLENKNERIIREK